MVKLCLIQYVPSHPLPCWNHKVVQKKNCTKFYAPLNVKSINNLNCNQDGQPGHSLLGWKGFLLNLLRSLFAHFYSFMTSFKIWPVCFLSNFLSGCQTEYLITIFKIYPLFLLTTVAKLRWNTLCNFLTTLYIKQHHITHINPTHNIEKNSISFCVVQKSELFTICL